MDLSTRSGLWQGMPSLVRICSFAGSVQGSAKGIYEKLLVLFFRCGPAVGERFVMRRKSLTELLDEPGDAFPRRSSIKIVCGKTLVKTSKWHKAVVLAEVDNKRQLRLCGWQETTDGEWRFRQKFNISKGYAARLSEILDAFATEV